MVAVKCLPSMGEDPLSNFPKGVATSNVMMKERLSIFPPEISRPQAGTY